jgi:hypothetical protein
LPNGFSKDSPVTLSAKLNNKWTLSIKSIRKTSKPKRKEWQNWVKKWRPKWMHKTVNKILFFLLHLTPVSRRTWLLNWIQEKCQPESETSWHARMRATSSTSITKVTL